MEWRYRVIVTIGDSETDCAGYTKDVVLPFEIFVGEKITVCGSEMTVSSMSKTIDDRWSPGAHYVFFEGLVSGNKFKIIDDVPILLTAVERHKRMLANGWLLELVMGSWQDELGLDARCNPIRIPRKKKKNQVKSRKR